VVSVGRLLRTMGLSPQRPLHRAYEQNPEAVARWKTEDYPAIRAARRRRCDDLLRRRAGIRSDYHSGTTWAPVGQTPVVHNTGRPLLDQHAPPRSPLRERCGSPCTRARSNAAVFIDFCKRLLHDAPGPVYLSWMATPATAPGHHRVRRLYRRQAAVVLPARLLTRTQPRRMGLEERQARPHRQDRRHPASTT